MKRLMILAAAAAMLTACGDTSKIDALISKNAAEEISSAPGSEPAEPSSAADTQPGGEVSLNEIDQQVIDDANSAISQYYSDTSSLAQQLLPVPDAETVKNGDIDIDLTKLDANLVYAQVFDMVSEPDKYIGKRVKARGTFAYTHDDSTGGDYFAVFMKDAAACCQQGLEFVLTGEHKYPEDYPGIDSDITVEGIFNTYTENGWQYCQLKDASMQISAQ
ncbi:MAG: hypothetical protein IKO27_03490 [Ruminococcus sp.]|nr:hypothetical protein [Ruminococcus sp.]